MSRPLLRLMYIEYWFRLSRLSMMVIGSFASCTKTKSVESAVWCLLTLDDDVEQVARNRNTWTWFRIRIVLFSFEQQQAKFNENENKTKNQTTNKINERLITNNDWRINAHQITNNEWRITGTKIYNWVNHEHLFLLQQV